MAEKKGFDLAGLMKSVSELNTREQIEYLPFDKLDPDPNNFYSMDGLDALADSIATVGLVHPLRVRQNGERYMITSGHRRRAAIELLIGSGEEAWRDGVPCIVDHGEALPEFEELKLIFANSQRQKTSAELSREAERTEQLLVKLKEKGYSFPGRMQDHVAQAMNVNASKLKRLHAIRSNAHPYVLKAYDAGEINESVAYEFSKIPNLAQGIYMIQRRRACMRLDILTAEEVRWYYELYCKLRDLRCKPAGCNCPWSGERIEEALRQTFGYHDNDDAGKPFGLGNCTKGKCCLECKLLLECEAVRCRFTEPEVKTREEAREQRSKELQEAREADQKIFDRARAEAVETNAAIWARIRRAAERSGADPETVAETFFDPSSTAWGARLIRGEEDDPNNAGLDLLADELESLADALHCSTDFLLGRTEEPAVNRGKRIAASASPPRNDGEDRADEGIGPYAEATKWQHGEPETEGWYACLGTWADIPERLIAYWRDGAWYEEITSRRTMSDTKITAFYPLPALPDPEEV